MVKKAIFALLLVFVFTATAFAQLTDPQKVTLKADILANSDANTFYQNGDLDSLAALYNLNASPTFIVWKTNVTITMVGQTFNATELAGLTQLNTSRLQNLAAWMPAGVNPSISSVRQFFDDIFSGAGGANTRAALLALWKRSARRIEKLYATGTGSDGSPGLLVFEGTLKTSDLIGL